MKHFDIHMDTGAVVRLDADDVTVTFGKLNSDIRHIEWESAGTNHPLWLDVNRVVAVMEVQR